MKQKRYTNFIFFGVADQSLQHQHFNQQNTLTFNKQVFIKVRHNIIT